MRRSRNSERGTNSWCASKSPPKIWTRFPRRFRPPFEARFKDKGPEIRRVELVGPKVGKDLKEKAIWAIGLSFLAILIYVAGRFHQVSYGLGGIVALVHDMLITLGRFPSSTGSFRCRFWLSF